MNQRRANAIILQLIFKEHRSLASYTNAIHQHNDPFIYPFDHSRHCLIGIGIRSTLVVGYGSPQDRIIGSSCTNHTNQ
jgi:hypothetical protein